MTAGDSKGRLRGASQPKNELDYTWVQCGPPTWDPDDCGKVDEDRVEVDVKADLASGNGTASEEDPWDSLHGPSLSSGA